jgi:hypothetical protein
VNPIDGAGPPPKLGYFDQNGDVQMFTERVTEYLSLTPLHNATGTPAMRGGARAVAAGADAAVPAVIVTNRAMSRLLADLRATRRSDTTVYCRDGTVLPHGVAVCHRWIIASGVRAIVPGSLGVGLRAVAIVRRVAVIAGAGIVAVIPMVGIVVVIPVVVEGIAITPPKRWVGSSEPEHGAEMPKAMVEPAALKPSASAVKSPAATAAIIGIDHLWLNNGGGKQQCC